MKSKQKIVIFGAGDLAIEVAVLIRHLNDHVARWELAGFVVEDPNLFGTRIWGYPIIEGLEALRREQYEGSAAIGVGSPEIAFKIRQQIHHSGLSITFPSLVHPSAIADFEHLTLAEGVVVGAGCLMTTQISLGAFTYANIGCSIGHGTQTGEFCRIHPQTHVAGAVILENFVNLGAGALIMQYKKIGEGAQVSMGSVISTDVAPWSVMAGNPARTVKKMTPWTTES